MSQIPKLNRISASERRFSSRKGMILMISLQSTISSSPRGVTRSYFTRTRLRAVRFISGLLSAAGTTQDHPLTPWPHRFSPRRNPRSDHLRSSLEPALEYPYATRFVKVPHEFRNEFCTKSILAPIY